ncbi:MAG: NfeD family protein [Proteobacteria bacterium]|nr:NfeD family protein [Pseudomonadota bacterium]
MDAVSAFYFAHPFWVWLGIGAIFLVIELSTGSGWLLWPAGSAAIVAVTSLFVALGSGRQAALFAICTVVTTYLGRRFMPRGPSPAPDINDQLGRLIGHKGECCGPIESGEGRVFVDGKEWSAELEGGGALPDGAKVEVAAVLGGARLQVRPTA